MSDDKMRDPKQQGPKPPFEKQTQPPPGRESDMSPEPDCGENTYRGFGRLKDRVALITGGDSGIGRAVALAFAREGADVAISYLQPEEEDAVRSCQLVEREGRRALKVRAELSTANSCRELAQQVIERFRRIDILVNNSGFQGKSVERFEDLDPDRIEKTFRVNIIAMFHLIRCALPAMRAGSAIINVSSIQAYQPNPSILDYAATKGAIVTFTKGLAQSLIGRGIRANAVAPGPVWTPLVVQSFGKEKIAKFGEDNPMERPAQPAELAPAFVFLASNESRYVNGEVLGVTGGRPLP